MKAVDLFSGCGGMSLGFQNAGFEVLAAYDNWDPAVSVYKDNFKHPIFQMDLKSSEAIAHIAQFKPDIIIGGPPCQDFSIAGKREFEGRRADLTLRFAEIVSTLKPEWFVMENVYNIEKSPVLAQAMDILRAAGYGITTRVLDACHCGVPQARQRFFMIGRLREEDGFLTETLQKSLSHRRMTVHDYLGDNLGTEFYYMHPRTYMRRGVFSIHEPSATIRGINRPIPANYQRHHADKASIQDGVRSLTTKERSYIQTFPEWFAFNGKQSDMELAIGNAVPVNLATYVAKRILEFSETAE
jgi:DNA (cytosine-5)-methyltransferase 1